MFDAIRNWFRNLHKLPEAKMAEFRSEGLLLYNEYIKAKLTYLHFKAPGKRFLYKTVWFRSYVVVTQARVWATAYTKLAIDVPFTDERIRKMQFSVEGERLLISFDAGLFQPSWSGTLEYRFLVPNAASYVAAIQQEIVAHG